jgi:hypothetical protein
MIKLIELSKYLYPNMSANTTTSTESQITSLKWPKFIYAFVWLKKTPTESNKKDIKKENIMDKYDMSGKLVFSEILSDTEQSGCEYCSLRKIPLSLYSGKVVCNKCALFQERPLD